MVRTLAKEFRFTNITTITNFKFTINPVRAKMRSSRNEPRNNYRANVGITSGSTKAKGWNNSEKREPYY